MFRDKIHKLLILLTLSVPVIAAAETPIDAPGWFQQAQAARQAGNLDAAYEALDAAEELGFAPLRVQFERARLHTLSSEPGEAVAVLRSIADAGFTSVGFIVNDPILSTLEGNAGYDEIVAAMSKLAYPCESDETFREFDFWVGEWDVHGPGGTPAGTNSIQKEERGCVLIEKWTNTAGGTGQSINYVDKISGEWVQIWNAEGGSQINIRGGMTDEGMALVGTLHTISNGTTIPFRGLWTPLPDGRVRQFFEQSNDGGETWTTWFEGFYTRKE